MKSRFVHGTTYYHFANPVSEFDENFAKMRGMGLNAVRVAEVWPGWSVLEPRPGEFDFSELDQYVEKATQAGLSVIMGIGINDAPMWVYNDLSDVRTRDARGGTAQRRIQSANHDHPQYRALMERFIESQVKHYSTSKGIIAWQFGNEIRFGVSTPDNECTRIRFRSWLRERYGEIDIVNRLWGTQYRTWEEVYPYGSVDGAPTEGITPLHLASQMYKAWSLEEMIAWGCAIIRRHSSLPVFHNNHSISGTNYSHFRICKPCDMVVIDLYPTTSSKPQVFANLYMDQALSVARIQKKPLWVGEIGIGQYGTYGRSRPSQPLIELLVMETVACGIEGLLYFRHKAPKYEQPHKFTGSQSALRRDGSEYEYAKTVRNVATVMDTLGERIDACTSAAPLVAVYLPEESLKLSGEAKYSDIQTGVIQGVSALYNQCRLPIQFLDTDGIVNENLSRYKMIHVPVAYLIPSSVGARLAQYVRDGGFLLCESRPGYVDEHGWLYERQPGAGLDELCGAREDLFWNPPTINVNVHYDRTVGSAAFPALAQTYRLMGGRSVAATDEKECIAVEHRFGEGTSVLLGFSPSLLFSSAGGKYEDAPSKMFSSDAGQQLAIALVKNVSARAGVKTPVDFGCESLQVTARFLEGATESVVYCANHGPDTSLRLPENAKSLVLSHNGELSFGERTGTIELCAHSWILFACRRPD